MTLEKKVAALVADTAVIQILRPDVGTFLVAHAVFVDGRQWGGKALRWCPPFPEDQHHVHTTRYTRAAVDHDRYVLLYDPEVLVACMGPATEFEVDARVYAETMTRWRRLLAVNDNQARFDDFFRTA